MNTVLLAAINRNVVIIEAVIGGVILLLIIGIVVMSRRRKKAAAPKVAAEVPNYYADLQQQQPAARPDPFGGFAAATAPSAPPMGDAPGSSPMAPPPAPAAGPDLSAYMNGVPAGGGAAPWPSNSWSPGAPGSQGEAAVTEQPQPAAATATVPLQPQGSPPPGTPAGWLPDPSGTPDTLRYWDGNAWTPHFAQRS